MNAMTHDAFRAACDKLSARVDADQFERFRFQRDEVPKLNRMFELIKASVADRSDVELNEEGGTQNSKGFILKVHGKRVAAVSVALEEGQAVLSITTAARSEYGVVPGEPIAVDYAEVDEAWIGAGLSQLFTRIRPARAATAEG